MRMSILLSINVMISGWRPGLPAIIAPLGYAEGLAPEQQALDGHLPIAILPFLIMYLSKRCF